MTTLSPDEISERIEALDTKLRTLDDETATSALAAAEGDAVAASRLAEIMDERRLTAADREILVQARTAARWRSYAAADQANEETRAQHRADAVDHLRDLEKLAGEADRLIEQFQRLRAAINAKEDELRTSARGAGISINGPRLGMRGAAAHLSDSLKRFADGTVKSNTVPRSISDFVASGWVDLQQGDIR